MNCLSYAVVDRDDDFATNGYQQLLARPMGVRSADFTADCLNEEDSPSREGDSAFLKHG